MKSRHFLATCFAVLALFVSSLVFAQDEIKFTPTVLPDSFLLITVDGEPALTRAYQVDAEGQLAIPLIGGVEASGKNLQDLKDLITVKLKKYILQPVVTVQSTLEADRPGSVMVMGQVNEPGAKSIPIQGSTLLDVIFDAGGLHLTADARRIRVTHAGQNQSETREYSFTDVLIGNIKNPVIQNGDSIFIPEANYTGKLQTS